jgi:ABC-type multidrug transport system fused ATPase/permease subunit
MFFSTIIPITAYVSSRFANGLFQAAAKEGEASVKQASRALETISNFKEVFSFSNQPLEEARFSETQKVSSMANVNTGKAKALFEAANRAGIYINIILLFGVGGLLVTKNLVQPLVLVSFIGYCFSLNFATQGLLFSYGDLKTIAASWEKIQKFKKEATFFTAGTDSYR